MCNQGVSFLLSGMSKISYCYLVPNGFPKETKEKTKYGIITLMMEDFSQVLKRT